MSTNGTNGSNHDGANGASEKIIPLQINGKEVKTSTTFDVVDPSTGKVIWKSASASKEDAMNAIEAAQAAFPAWSKTKPAKRRNILLKAAEILQSRVEELGGYMMTETGSQTAFATGFNIPTSVEMLKDIAGRIVTIAGSVPVCGEEGTNAIVYKEPYGVVLGIAPWNAPYILGFRAVAYALATGNTTILKAPEFSPRCYWAIGSVFQEAGLPAGCLNVLAHRPQDAAEITTLLIEHPSVKKINFTGSTHVGGIIAAAAGKALKPVLMELGGKASAIVLADADLQKAATQCALGAFFHSGQVCMATERIIVHSSIADAFATHLSKAIANIFPASGPAPVLVSPAGVKKNHALVSDALAKGAHLAVGSLPDAPSPSSTRMRPLVVSHVTPAMDLYRTESFGPTVSLFVVDSDAEAVVLANDTEYGLTCAVFTEDLRRGLEVARGVESGAVHINSMTIHDEPALPHGGVKMSGFGRFNAAQGLEEFLRSKTVTWRD
ncbi:hypothetical protein MMC34_003253 [Xylographa carneopallida]|nr:hypothetical protein [Xylographa carneopallida]